MLNLIGCKTKFTNGDDNMEKIEESKFKTRSKKVINYLKNSRGKRLRSLHKLPMKIQQFAPKVVDVDRGYLELELKVSEQMVNPFGFFHGGMQCVVLDDAMALAAATLGNENFSITINMVSHYLGKCKLNDVIRVYSKVIREGKSIIHLRSSIRHSNGEIITKSSSDLLLTNINRDYVHVPFD